MNRQDFRCLHRLRVRWVEVDVQKIVFNGHYLMYADTAMAEYWRALALPYEASMQALGGEMYVRKATVDYHASARLDDSLEVGLRCTRVGNSSCQFVAGIFRGETLLVSVELVYVFADPITQRPKPIPPVLRALFEGYEAGEDPVQLRFGDWTELGPLATPLRAAVFIDEQGVPPELELDALDATAIHAVLCNRLDQPIATARLLQPEPGVGHIGRMAVDRAVRGAHWGRQVLEGLAQVAQARGDHLLRLHAQCTAEGFYRRLGFTPLGAVFEDAGMPHIAMERRLVG